MGIDLVLILSAIMGLSILISYPLVMSRSITKESSSLLTAFAAGILIFLIADIFQTASSTLYNTSLLGYGTNLAYDMIFVFSVAAGFFLLFAFEFRSTLEIKAMHLSLLISIGIGLQNLTEGMIFGSQAFSIGLTGVALVVFAGFILQNITEGFPIGSPFMGNSTSGRNLVPFFFLIGGVPTIIGGGVGYYFNSPSLDLLFDGLSIGAIIYVILPMLRIILSGSGGRMRQYLYVSLFSGFIAGMLVNFI